MDLADLELLEKETSQPQSRQTDNHRIRGNPFEFELITFQNILENR